MYSKPCPVEGCDVVLRDDDMDRLIDHMKAHIKTHDPEDEPKMKPGAAVLVEDETVRTGDDGDDQRRVEEDEANEYRNTIDIEDGIVLTVTDGTPSPTPNIARALCEMQKADLGAIADSSNPFFKNSKYADLSSVWGVIRKPLTDAGLSIMQYPERFHGGITVVTRLYHVSGEMFETRLSGTTVLQPVKEKGVVVGEGKATVQGLGSLITYLRRYSISMLVGVAPKDDDDGNAAIDKPSTKKRGGD